MNLRYTSNVKYQINKKYSNNMITLC